MAPAGGRKAAELRLEIQNTKGSESFTLDVLPATAKSWEPGDRILWRGRIYRLFRISFERIYERENGVSFAKIDSVQIVIGRAFPLAVTMTPVSEE